MPEHGALNPEFDTVMVQKDFESHIALKTSIWLDTHVVKAQTIGVLTQISPHWIGSVLP